MASGNSKALRKFVAATKFIFHRGFNASRCKAEAKMATARIKLLRNKRKEQIMQIKRDIAKLLESGQEDIARIRVEHVIREQNILAANEIIELFCDLVVNRLPIITKERKCPVDLKEGISSLIYAAPRCSELPELLRIRDIFEKKYGKDFSLGASELRPDSCVNRLLIEKLSVAKPSGEVKIKAMKAIAKEFQVKWDPAETEQDLLKPPEERLSGPSTFVSASNLPMRINQPMQNEANYANNLRYSNSLEEEEDSTAMQFTNCRDEDNATTLQFTNSTKDDNSTTMQFANSIITNSREDNNSTAARFTDSTAMQFKDTASAAKAAARYAAKAAQAASSAARLSKQENSISNNTFESTKNRLSLNGSNGSDSCTDSEEADSKRGRNGSNQRYDNSKEEENSQSFKSTKNRFSLNGSNGSTHPKDEETESCTESEEVDSKRGVFVKFDDSDGLDSDQESKNKIFDEEREYSGRLKNKNGIFGEEREYSGSTGSRVHPKMPDYEELTARFEKLRSSGGKCDH